MFAGPACKRSGVQVRLGLVEHLAATEFKYLDSVCCADLPMKAEVNQRLASAGRPFHKLTCIKL